jgi:predicted RNase H-like HicB family nuclease
MQGAEYEKLEDGTWYGEVSELKFTGANAPPVEECRTELREEAEDRLVFAISRHSPIPTLGGINIAVPQGESTAVVIAR